MVVLASFFGHFIMEIFLSMSPGSGAKVFCCLPVPSSMSIFLEAPPFFVGQSLTQLIGVSLTKNTDQV